MQCNIESLKQMITKCSLYPASQFCDTYTSINAYSKYIGLRCDARWDALWGATARHYEGLQQRCRLYRALSQSDYGGVYNARRKYCRWHCARSQEETGHAVTIHYDQHSKLAVSSRRLRVTRTCLKALSNNSQN
jgi:hypothetical protein